MSCFSRWLNGVLLVALIVGGPLAYYKYRRANFRNFRIVHNGVLYRSGQLSKKGLDRVIHDFSIRTVVTLRDAHRAGDPPPDAAEEKYCYDLELNYFRLPPRGWLKRNGSAPTDENVALFLEIMDKPLNRPVLVHCWDGTHRTGAFVAIYRMEYERWSNEEAIAELMAKGYGNLPEQNDISEYLQTYEPRWKRSEVANRPR